MPPKTSTRKPKRKTASRSTSSSGGSSTSSTKHLASAMQLLAERVVFVNESDKIAFQDYLTSATGGENKEQLTQANERIKERETAHKEANPA